MTVPGCIPAPMMAASSFPVVQGRLANATSVTGTEHVLALPSGITAGELLIVLAVRDGNANLNVEAGGGFTEFYDSISEISACRIAAGYKVATGGETTITIGTGVGPVQKAA